MHFNCRGGGARLRGGESAFAGGGADVHDPDRGVVQRDPRHFPNELDAFLSLSAGNAK